MEHLVFAVYVLATAFAFARLEIEIEGPHGWAEKLPTWRLSNRCTKLLWGCRPLTGYHFWVLILFALFAHLPFALGLWTWSLQLELRVIAFFILLLVIEDFLWFVLNPHFGVRRFRRQHIWWHAPAWWWCMPRDYWLFLPIGVAMYAISWA